MKCPDLPEKTLLRPDEVAEFFSVSVKTIYAWCDNGSLRTVKINGTIRIYRTSIVRIVECTDNTVEYQQKGSRRILSNGIRN